MLYRFAGSAALIRATRTVGTENIVVGASDQGHERCGGFRRMAILREGHAAMTAYGTIP